MHAFQLANEGQLALARGRWQPRGHDAGWQSDPVLSQAPQGIRWAGATTWRREGKPPCGCDSTSEPIHRSRVASDQDGPMTVSHDGILGRGHGAILGHGAEGWPGDDEPNE